MSALSNSDETKKKCEKILGGFVQNLNKTPMYTQIKKMGNFGKNEQNPHDNLSLKYMQKLLK